MRKTLLTLFFALMTVAGWCNVTVNGINYDLNAYDNHGTTDNVAEVVSGSYTGVVVIPETINYDGVTYTVASIRFSAFANCQGLTSVTIPNTVTLI